HCEVRLDGDSGPEVVCRLERARGPLRILSPLAEREREGRVDVLVDGHPIRGPAEDVRPGSRVEVLDRLSGRRYRLLVDPQPPWMLRPRVLALALAVLAIAGAIYGAYVFRTLQGAKGRLVVTEERLRQTESDIERARATLTEIERRVSVAQNEFALALRELQRAQADSERAIRSEFDQRLSALTERARAELEKISERDLEARSRLQAESRAQVEALRQELEDRMVGAYQEFKAIEERLLKSLGSRIEAVTPASEHFKQVLGAARGSLLFLRTTFDVEFTRSGEVVSQENTGSGFFVSDAGLALTAQHVLFPWKFDRNLQVLVSLELARVREDSVVWQAWTTDTRVHTGGEGDLSFELGNAWRSDAEHRALLHLYSPPLEMADTLMDSPLGSLVVPMPRAGADDVGVLQIVNLDVPARGLALSSVEPESLDEALAVGYPLSRLEEGKAVPQAVTGFVRGIPGELLELNTAFHPGLSGGPILNRDGDVIGMAIGVLDSVVYGLAVLARDLELSLGGAAEKVRAEEARLQALGCDPGPVDGVFDTGTWEAYRCERAKGG
ncbi:MAG: trypsin-like peptidase domain-containing protein, partial [Gammaproteobacteria bacterium]|nr:trypsin-like peptidase domain-containing protein [Gammaproteobacteria bacterium]